MKKNKASMIAKIFPMEPPSDGRMLHLSQCKGCGEMAVYIYAPNWVCVVCVDYPPAMEPVHDKP